MFATRWASETLDAKDLSLGDGQDELIAALAKTRKRVVVVLQTGGPVDMPWLASVDGVVEAWYPGQMGGEAIARVLTGEINPSGRLPITFPASTAQLPNPLLPGSTLPEPTLAQKREYGVQADKPPFDAVYPEGSNVGYRWYSKQQLKPLFPFGYGLTYTKFAYKNAKVTGGETITATFDVKNTGKVKGADVPQVYAMIGGAKRLIGWERVELAPGESKTVTVVADPRLIARFDSQRQAWRVDPATITVDVGGSATDVKLKASAKVVARTIKP